MHCSDPAPARLLRIAQRHLLRLGRSFVWVSVLLLGVGTSQLVTPVHSEPARVQATVDKKGTAHLPGFAVPVSNYMSEEAKKSLAARPYASLMEVDWAKLTPDEQGDAVRSWYRPMVERARAAYDVNISEQWIAGVRTDIVTPKQGVSPSNRGRVLLALHGGSYSHATSGGIAGLVEAIPVAGSGRVKVISIDYRTSPAHKFPAAVKDVVAVYTELLKTHDAANVGIYGCSTGATLTANVVAWLQKDGISPPGAIALLCGGATKDDQLEGDSYYVAPALMGDPIPAPGQPFGVEPYLEGTDPLDPLVAPVVSLQVLSRFPPTLLITGTRDISLSAAVYTHSRLVRAGVDARLHVWDGMWHGFFFDVDLPESKEAYDVITRFFDARLRRTSRDVTDSEIRPQSVPSSKASGHEL